MLDYSKYECSWQENMLCLLVSVAISGLLARLFYRSAWGMLLIPIVFTFGKKMYKETQIKKRRHQLLVEFTDALLALSTALLAGYSIENAWQDVEQTMIKMHGDKSLMLVEIKKINVAIRMNHSMETALEDFAKRSACEEIESFTEVFVFAKRSGGDFIKIIRGTTEKIAGRMDVEQEIETVLAGKKLEGNIMSVMPILILAYMTMSAGDFLDVLYGNLMGVVLMTIVLIGYAIALWLTARILDIRI